MTTSLKTIIILQFLNIAGLPHGQKKSGNHEQSGKLRKMTIRKSQEKIIKTHQKLSVQNKKIPYIFKPSIGKI